MDDILYSAVNYNPIYVSQSDHNSIEYLEKELDNDARYSKRITAGLTFRERFTTRVYCKDCDNNVCNPGVVPLWHNRPVEIRCEICEFIYYSAHQDSSVQDQI